MKKLVYCFAKDKMKVLDKLEDQSEPLIKHLVKYFLYPNHLSSSHWGDEIFSFLNNVSKLKKKNKRPTSEVILKSTWNVYEDSILEYIPTVQEDYGISYVDSKTVYNDCKQYMVWLAEKLSDVGSVSRNSCKCKLKEIEGANR